MYITSVYETTVRCIALFFRKNLWEILWNFRDAVEWFGVKLPNLLSAQSSFLQHVCWRIFRRLNVLTNTLFGIDEKYFFIAHQSQLRKQNGNYVVFFFFNLKIDPKVTHSKIPRIEWTIYYFCVFLLKKKFDCQSFRRFLSLQLDGFDSSVLLKKTTCITFFTIFGLGFFLNTHILLPSLVWTTKNHMCTSSLVIILEIQRCPHLSSFRVP